MPRKKVDIDNNYKQALQMRRYRRKRKAKLNKILENKEVKDLIKKLWKT